MSGSHVVSGSPETKTFWNSALGRNILHIKRSFRARDYSARIIMPSARDLRNTGVLSEAARVLWNHDSDKQ